MSNLNLIATRIRDGLSGEEQKAYLQALNEAKQGQTKLSLGDWEGCLTYSMRAYDLLTNIPETSPILGVELGSNLEP